MHSLLLNCVWANSFFRGKFGVHVEITRTQPPPIVWQVHKPQRVKYLPFGYAEVPRLFSATVYIIKLKSVHVYPHLSMKSIQVPCLGL